MITETKIYETSLKTNPGDLIRLDETQVDGETVHAFTITVNDNDACFNECGCDLLIKDAFPGREGIVLLPTGCSDRGRTITGKSVGAPHFVTQYGDPARYPALGSRVRLSGALTPAMHDDRAHILFIVREVIVLPTRTFNAARRKSSRRK